MSTRVKFVMFKDELLALFPDEKYSNNPNDTSIMSYAHNGQHGAASKGLMKLRYIKKSVYNPLLKELKSIGYDDLEVLNEKS